MFHVSNLKIIINNFENNRITLSKQKIYILQFKYKEPVLQTGILLKPGNVISPPKCVLFVAGESVRRQENTNESGT